MVTGEVLAAILPLEVLQAEIDDAVVEVLAAEVRVPRRRRHLEDPVLDRQQRNIEGASSHVIDQNVAFARRSS